LRGNALSCYTERGAGLRDPAAGARRCRAYYTAGESEAGTLGKHPEIDKSR
jgi:hypothetical protein